MNIPKRTARQRCTTPMIQEVPKSLDSRDFQKPAQIVRPWWALAIARCVYNYNKTGDHEVLRHNIRKIHFAIEAERKKGRVDDTHSNSPDNA